MPSFVNVLTGPPNNDPKRIARDIFFLAEAFYKSYLLTKDSSVGFDFIQITYASLASNAFSCELYMKSLYYLENAEHANRVHSLLDLYLKLSDGAKAEIKKHYEQIFIEEHDLYFKTISDKRKEILRKETGRNAPFVNPIVVDILEVLRKGGEGFVTFRYAYQNIKGQPYEYECELVVKGIRRYISKLHPQWFKRFQIHVE